MYHLSWTAALLLALASASQGSPADADLHPSCENPAPLLGLQSSDAPGYIVVFREGTHVRRTLARLRRTYRFKPEHVFGSTLPGFSAQLSDAVLAGIRCEPEVQYVEYNTVLTPG